jgi:dihydroorotate dehydrogenase electron transfer subunit
MTDKKFEVLKNVKLTPDIYRLVLKTDLLPKINCGQFANVKIPNRPELLLRRPFSINAFDYKKNTMDIVFKVSGAGTNELSRLSPRDTLEIFLPLGNGFIIKPKQKRVALVGGGLGVCPLLSVPLSYHDKQYFSFLGFSSLQNAILTDSFKGFSEEIFVSSDDGSIGKKGFITEQLKHNLKLVKPDIILSCGPRGMFKALKDMTAELKTEIYISLEERMACGLGACLVCACDVVKDGLRHKKRVCKDGPVFNIDETDFA